MTIIQIGKKLYPFPQQWNDLSQKQLLAVMDILVNGSNILVTEANARFFKIMCNASWWRLLLNPIDVQENIHLVEWLYASQPEKLLTKNLLPEYKGFWGPSDEFGNLVALEFFWGQHFYDEWAKTKQPHALDMLVATLYRPMKAGYNINKNPDGDVREPYNSNLTEAYAKVVAAWPGNVKEAIAKWFEHNFLALRQKYPEPFVRTGGDPSKYGFVSLFRDVAERGIHGDFKNVEKMNIHLFFIEISEVLIKDSKLN